MVGERVVVVVEGRSWMLTVERREDGRKGIGLGFGGRMEENELEEGEACYGHEEEGSSPEKDLTNLSYIVWFLFLFFGLVCVF